MSNEDMAEMIQKLSSMMQSSSENSPPPFQEKANSTSENSEVNIDMLQELLRQLQSNPSHSDETVDMQSNASVNEDFHLDMNTILKMKTVMEKMNSNKNDPRSNLLLSLKPYLNQGRKEKLDQYMQFLKISKVIEAFQSDMGVQNK